MIIFSKGKIKTVNRIKDRVNKTSGSSFKDSKRKLEMASGDGGSRRRKKPVVIQPLGVRDNVWVIPSGFNSGSDSTGHPAPFPESLAHDHIVSWSNEGDTVCDPFMGSGTTGKMAKVLGRNFIGIEKVPEFFEISKNRIGSV